MVTEEKSKDALNNLLGELDNQDEDDLQEVEMHQAQAVTIMEDESKITFNRQERMAQKYGRAVNDIS